MNENAVNPIQEEALDPKDFQIQGADTASAELFARKPVTYWRDAWRRFFENKLAVVALCLLIVITLCTIFVPMFSSHSISAHDLLNRKQWPSAQHWFGTVTCLSVCGPAAGCPSSSAYWALPLWPWWAASAAASLPTSAARWIC